MSRYGNFRGGKEIEGLLGGSGRKRREESERIRGVGRAPLSKGGENPKEKKKRSRPPDKTKDLIDPRSWGGLMTVRRARIGSLERERKDGVTREGRRSPVRGGRMGGIMG